MAKPSLGQLRWLISAALVHPNLPPHPGESGEELECQPPPTPGRSRGPSLRAVDTEAQSLSLDACERVVEGVAECEGCRPSFALCAVGVGRGWTPGICSPAHHPGSRHRDPELYQAALRSLSPGEDIPRSRWASGGWGLGPGWADGLAPAVPDPKGCSRSPCKWVNTRGRALRRRHRQNVLRFQGAISGAGGRAAVHRAPRPSPAALVVSPTPEMCVCLSPSLL